MNALPKNLAWIAIICLLVQTYAAYQQIKFYNEQLKN